MKEITLTLDHRAKGLAADYLRTEGQLLSVLMEMRRRKVFAELNYTGIFDYCERALNFSRAQAFYFKTVAEKSEEVPEIRTAVIQGELTLSQARRIVPVVTKDNHKEWIEKAKNLPQKELEREVTAVNPKAHVQEKVRPVARALSELKVGVDEKTEKNLRTLQNILSQKMGKPATMAQVIAWAMEVTREKFDPMRRAERLISSRKEASPTEAPKIKSGRNCIAASVRHPVVLRARPTITSHFGAQLGVRFGRSEGTKVEAYPSICRGFCERRAFKDGPEMRCPKCKVIVGRALRDRMQCTYVSQDGRRCEERRWLDLHHIVEVAKGGPNTIDNLRVLCRAHHDLVHSERPLMKNGGIPTQSRIGISK